MVYARKPGSKPRRQAVSASYTFPAPIRGVVLNEPLGNSKPGGARVLENFFPTTTGARTRGGSQKVATIGTEPVRRMWAFKSGSAEEFFASDEENIFNITSVADPDVPPVPVVTGQSEGYYSVAQFGTAGGNYLYAVNGADDAQLYDGLTWKAINTLSTPAFSGVATAALSFVWSFASRLFFVEKNTMNVWYLPVDSIGGAASVFSLAGVFQDGGSVLAGGKWSLDSGDGLDDKILFISTEGEVAVFQGLFPGDASWNKVGVYKITPPVGPNATMSAGGDFLVGTQDGIVPISEAVNKDAAALSLSAVTRTIESEWKKQVPQRASRPWEILKWPTNNMMVVSLPGADDGIPTLCFAANLQTGAWGFFTGWDAQCMTLFGGDGYFGTSKGTIHRMEDGGSDDGLPYTCTYVALPDQMRRPGAFKIVHSARATFNSNIPFLPKISASMDYRIDLPAAPQSASDLNTSLWDVGLWDVAVWDTGSVSEVSTRWVSIGNSGYAVSPQIQITCGTGIKPVTELIQLDAIYELGAVMV
ncbi:hypothetical protein FHX08_004775 [Rhizobium sp. BK529]|uniref:hypothetical protein n=1 Tax=Rhizobium sp. BK529 TaxID=2586983 RepID=UPI00161D2783|nr:hypothetical protein [Rhizobium sp. BK529]MBB3594371.1 hypothetical protein [Rhizobium sp. BK529]